MSSPDKRNPPVLTVDERNNIRASLADARADGNYIRQHIAETEAKLQSLFHQKEQVNMNISQLEKTLVIHRILPREIIGHIFSLLCAERISIPHIRKRIPPQITVSHVCSKWREIALETPVLWSSVEITRPDKENLVQIAMALLFNRASAQGVNLMLNMQEVSLEDWINIFHDTVLPFHVKNLHLCISPHTPESFESQELDDLFADIDEITLEIKPRQFKIYDQASTEPQFFNRITSLMILEHINLDLYDFPWTKMRVLGCNMHLSLTTVFNILSQCPLLEVCGVHIENDDAESMDPETLSLGHLHIFHIFLHGDNTDANEVLRSFRCPNLKDFLLEISYWTPDTYKIIESHYNLSQLERFQTCVFPYPLRKLLFDAPTLQELIITEKVFIDDKAIQGISFGQLGRHLKLLAFGRKCNAMVALDMVASRQKHVNKVVEASRSWRDPLVSSIKRLILWDQRKELEGKGDELKEMGISVAYSDDEPLVSHPFYPLFDEYC